MGVLKARRPAKAAPEWTSAAARRIRELAGPDATSVEEAVPAVVVKLLDGIACPPTAFEDLCRRLDVASIVEEAIPVGGELQRTTEGYRIVCSAGQPETRRRFTIAHELAHIVFERSGSRFPRAGAELERLCNMVAAEMLMPTHVFTGDLPAQPTAADVSRLASKYRTSLSAAAIRCAEFRPVSVFAIDDGRVSWARGPVQPHAIRAALEGLMRQAFDGALFVLSPVQ
jgi:hypothetical protein